MARPIQAGSGSVAVLQLHHREAFEKTVGRAVVAGTLAGVAHLASVVTGFATPLSYLAMALVVAMCARGDRTDRILLTTLGFVLPAIPWALSLTPSWTVGLSAAIGGALLVRSRQNERGEEGQIGEHRPGVMHYGLGALACAVLALCGLQVAEIFAQRLRDSGAPSLLQMGVGGAILGLFVGLSSISAHLGLQPDPVEARCEELIPQLSGDFQSLAIRALSLYRQCGESLAKLPREPAREELARTLSQMTREAVELAADWTGVEAQLHERAHEELKQEIGELTQSAAATKDLISRKQLELAAASLREELEKLASLSLRRERIVAKLRAEVALLDRARVALIGLRSGHVQAKAAELSALARKFRALSSVQLDEANLAEETAISAELSQLEAMQAAGAIEAVSSPEPSALEPEGRASGERQKV